MAMIGLVIMPAGLTVVAGMVRVKKRLHACACAVGAISALGNAHGSDEGFMGMGHSA